MSAERVARSRTTCCAATFSARHGGDQRAMSESGRSLRDRSRSARSICWNRTWPIRRPTCASTSSSAATSSSISTSRPSERCSPVSQSGSGPAAICSSATRSRCWACPTPFENLGATIYRLPRARAAGTGMRQLVTHRQRGTHRAFDPHRRRLRQPEPAVVRTVLGSCIAVCLRDPRARIGGMNHFMLPDGDAGQPSAPATASMRWNC